MNTLESRLRRELPELADALAATDESALFAPLPEHAPGGPRRAARRSSARAVAAGLAAAMVAVLLGGLFVLRGFESSETVPRAPEGFGTWSAMPDAPIVARPFAVSAWTGEEAVFWAGSSLSRGFAFTDGAAYDPATNTWRTMKVPGWGHPGLTGVYFGGQLFALAKGGGTRVDPVSGTWVDLPPVDDMYLVATVATDDAIWGLGPTLANRAGQPDLAAARYDPSTDAWVDASVFEGTGRTAEILAALGRLDAQVVWTGQEILAWHGADGGLAFDPSSGLWRTVEPARLPSGTPSDGLLTVTDAGVALLAEVERTVDGATWDVAVHAGGDWVWRGARFPGATLESVTIAAAGDWVVLFSPEQGPVTVHAPTGAWRVHDEGPLAGLTAPNVVWTGSQLVVWGGVASAVGDRNPLATGATWTPPGRS